MSQVVNVLTDRGGPDSLGPGDDDTVMPASLSKRAKYHVENIGFRIAGLILGGLGLDRASAFSGWVWRTVAPRLSRHPRAIAHLTEAFPDKSPAEIEAIARAMWTNMGRTFGEAFHLQAMVDQGRVAFEGTEVLQAWAARAGGKVACAGHLGNWELAILGITRAGLRPWSLYQRVKNPLVGRRIAAMRRFLYTGGLVAKDSARPRQFLRIVRAGGTLGFLADLREQKGLAVPFFGRLAPSTTFPALLARDTEAPVLMVRMRRLDGARFVQSFETIETPVTDDRKADVAALTVAIQATFERYIRDAPEQWMWAHRRWG